MGCPTTDEFAADAESFEASTSAPAANANTMTDALPNGPDEDGSHERCWQKFASSNDNVARSLQVHRTKPPKVKGDDQNTYQHSGKNKWALTSGFEVPHHNIMSDKSLRGSSSKSIALDDNKSKQQRTQQPIQQDTLRVRFDCAEIREYAVTVGDHPLCGDVCPLTLDWGYAPGIVRKDLRGSNVEGKCCSTVSSRSISRMSLEERCERIVKVRGLRDVGIMEGKFEMGFERLSTGFRVKQLETLVARQRLLNELINTVVDKRSPFKMGHRGSLKRSIDSLRVGNPPRLPCSKGRCSRKQHTVTRSSPIKRASKRKRSGRRFAAALLGTLALRLCHHACILWHSTADEAVSNYSAMTATGAGCHHRENVVGEQSLTSITTAKPSGDNMKAWRKLETTSHAVQATVVSLCFRPRCPRCSGAFVSVTLRRPVVCCAGGVIHTLQS